MQAILFDLDDTLYPEIDFVYSGFQAVAAWIEKNYSIKKCEVYNEFQNIFAEGKQGKVFNTWANERNINSNVINKLIRIYRNHTPYITPYPGISDLLEKINSKYTIGLISDGYYKVQLRKFQALNLDEYFDVVTFSDKFGRKYWKPHPRPYLETLDKMELQPYNAIYIADNPEKDFYSPRKLGMDTIRLKMKNGIYAHLEPEGTAYEPNYTVKSIKELESQLFDMLTI